MNDYYFQSYSYISNGKKTQTRAEELHKKNNSIKKHNLYGNITTKQKNKTIKGKYTNHKYIWNKDTQSYQLTKLPKRTSKLSIHKNPFYNLNSLFSSIFNDPFYS